MRLRPLIAAAVTLGGLTLASQVSAASFNCARARTLDERAICADRTLQDRDVEMATLYSVLPRLLAMGGRGAVQDDQRAWLMERGRCGGNRTCLLRSYDRRIAGLRRGLDGVYGRGPF